MTTFAAARNYTDQWANLNFIIRMKKLVEDDETKKDSEIVEILLKIWQEKVITETLNIITTKGSVCGKCTQKYGTYFLEFILIRISDARYAY